MKYMLIFLLLVGSISSFADEACEDAVVDYIDAENSPVAKRVSSLVKEASVAYSEGRTADVEVLKAKVNYINTQILHLMVATCDDTI